MTHKARDRGVHMHPALKDSKPVGALDHPRQQKCLALKKYPPKDPKKLTDPEIEQALSECHLQCDLSEHGRAALAWMRAQAKAIDPSIADDAKPLTLARVISSHIVIAKRPNKRDCGECSHIKKCKKNPDKISWERRATGVNRPSCYEVV